MLVCKNLLVPRAEIAHLFMVDRADMPMKIRPPKAGEIAIRIRTVVTKQKNCVSYNVLAGVLNPDVIVRRGNVATRVLLEPLLRIVGEDDERGQCLANAVSKQTDLAFSSSTYS